LTKDEWSKLIRGALRNFAREATKERGEIDEAAKAAHLSRPAIEKMKSSGTGSVESWIKLFAYHHKFSERNVRSILDNLPNALNPSKAPDDLDLVFGELKRLYSKQELSAWMKLLLSKRHVEDHLGVTVNARLKAPKTRLKAASPKRTLK